MLAMIMPIKETSARRCSRKHRHATACRATLQQIAQDLVRTNWEGLVTDASLDPGIDRGKSLSSLVLDICCRSPRSAVLAWLIEKAHRTTKCRRKPSEADRREPSERPQWGPVT